MLRSVLGALSAELAIDAGSDQTRVLPDGRGVPLRFSSAVALLTDRDGRQRVFAVGDEAAAIEGREPADMRVARPIVGGVVTDFEVFEALLRHLMHEVHGRRLWMGPRVALAVPPATVEVERRALREALEAAGAREVLLVEQPLACAAGCGLPVHEACGHMVVDIGAGKTTVAVTSLGGVAQSRVLGVGGIAMDDAIRALLRDHHGLVISAPEAARLRRAIGSAAPGAASGTALARGRCVDSGWPRAVEVDAAALRVVLQPVVGLIADAVLATLERTAPDLAADIASTGVVLAGGAACLPGLDRTLGQSTGLPVVVAEAAEDATVRGAAAALHAAAAVAAG
jgi:rod shape-determining protein MreB